MVTKYKHKTTSHWNYLSSSVEMDLQLLLTGVGELNGVPVSVSLELSS